MLPSVYSPTALVLVVVDLSSSQMAIEMATSLLLLLLLALELFEQMVIELANLQQLPLMLYLVVEFFVVHVVVVDALAPVFASLIHEAVVLEVSYLLLH